MTARLALYCCGCEADVLARLTNGAEVYPRRPDLSEIPFWKCDDCGNSVGCHHKTTTPTKPLGVIPTPEIKRARQHIHKHLDPIWKSGKAPRGKIYAALSKALGRQYHTAEIRTITEAREIYRHVSVLRLRFGMGVTK